MRCTSNRNDELFKARNKIISRNEYQVNSYLPVLWKHISVALEVWQTCLIIFLPESNVYIGYVSASDQQLQQYMEKREWII